MGVARAVLETYVTNCRGYIWLLLALIVLAIVIILVAKKIKNKGIKRFTRWTTVIALLAAIAIIANVICWGLLYSTVSTKLNAHHVELSEETVAASKETSSRWARRASCF